MITTQNRFLDLAILCISLFTVKFYCEKFINFFNFIFLLINLENQKMKSYNLFYLLFGISITINYIACAAFTADNPYKYKIITNITSGYNNIIRPSDNITIDIKLSLKQISSIDEKNQIFTTNSYFGVFWSDSRLKWVPEDFGNVTYVLLQANKLWTPDC